MSVPYFILPANTLEHFRSNLGLGGGEGGESIFLLSKGKIKKNAKVPCKKEPNRFSAAVSKILDHSYVIRFFGSKKNGFNQSETCP